MENNQLIKLDGVLYKIKRFFNSIFSINKTEKVIEKPIFSPVRTTSNVLFAKEKLAKKLKTGEIDIYDLSDEEVDEMLEHFEKSIGEEVELKLFKAIEKQKEFSGILESFTEEVLVIRNENDTLIEFERSNIASVRLAVHF